MIKAYFIKKYNILQHISILLNLKYDVNVFSVNVP